MQAWERGYFDGYAREEVGPQLIIDAIRDELVGNPRYSVEQENQTLRDQAATLEQMQEYLDRLGVDLATMTDDEVLAMMQASPALEDQQLEQGGDSNLRGFIRFGKAKNGQREFQITLGAKRDLSTLLHELGHFYLEVMGDLAASENAPEQLISDMATIRRWGGAEDGKPLTTEQHEQFARGFERYLAEGKAPNPELQGAFARFKRWLIAVYKDLVRLNVELTDEVRAVFNRLVATDEQITAARQVAEAMPLFEDMQAAGMTDAEYKAYRDQLALAQEEAKVSVEQAIIREEERRRSKWWNEELARVRSEVAEEIDTLPVYQAMKALRTGVMPDGSRRYQTAKRRDS